jgi:hypothetical protein
MQSAELDRKAYSLASFYTHKVVGNADIDVTLNYAFPQGLTITN